MTDERSTIDDDTALAPEPGAASPPGSPDTEVPDTEVPDTEVLDTEAPDTEAPDTEAPAAGGSEASADGTTEPDALEGLPSTPPGPAADHAPHASSGDEAGADAPSAAWEGPASHANEGAANEDGRSVGSEAAAGEAPASDDTTSAFPHVELAPERAGRRVASGVRISTRLAAGVFAAAVLPAGIAASGLLLVPEDAPPPAAPAVPAGLPDELAAAERSLEGLEAELEALDAQRVERERAALEAALAEATPRLMQRVAEARDERRAAGASGNALRAPFTREELAPALASLGVTPEGARLVTGRDGAVIAPEGRAAPGGVELAALGDGVAALAVVVPREGGRALVARRCVAKEPLCLVEERPLPPAPSGVAAAQAGLGRARATLASLASPAPAPAQEAVLDARRLRLLLGGGALLLGALLGLLLARRLRMQLSTPLTALEARLRLLAAGRPSERSPLARPAELEALEDAVDALSETLGRLELLEDEAARRSRRLFALADVVGEAARGQLFLRAPAGEDVAEEALHEALNRLLEAFERQVVRMKSHLLVLAEDARDPRDAGGEAPPAEEGRALAMRRRIHGLRPVATLLGDISQRLAGLAKLPPAEARVPGELARLSEAIAQRAKTAHGLFDALEAEAARLPESGASEGRGLSPEQRRALEQLARDLGALAVDETLPTLVESLRGLDEGDVASRLATQG